MKMMKVALLGGAALAVTSAGAFADDLSNLKSSMESMPVIATPVADAPEGATITWGGYVRQALTYNSDDVDFTTTSINANGVHVTNTVRGDEGFDLASGRARIWVDATTPTSVGDVDVHISFNHAQNNVNGLNGVTLNEYWGTWHMTPELSFSGGGMGNGADFGQGETFGNTVGLNGSHITTDEQLRLSYASGPISFFVAVDDGNDVVGVHGLDEMPDFHANFGWSGDMFSLGLGAAFQSNAGIADNYQVAGNIKFNLGDAAKIWVAASMGEDNFAGVGDYFGVAGGIGANVTEATWVELTGGYKETDVGDVMNVNAGIYWNPVSQLKLGLQGDYTDFEVGDRITASFVAWWYF
jgi:hypothetical protein